MMSKKIVTVDSGSEDEYDAHQNIVSDDEEEVSVSMNVETEDVVPTSYTKKTKTLGEKTGLSDRKAIQLQVQQAMKQYAADVQKSYDELLATVSGMCMTVNKPSVTPKNTKRTPVVSVKCSNISKAFKDAYLSKYDKETILARDLFSTLAIHAFDDDKLRKSTETYKNLSLTDTEIKILKKIKDVNSPLNVTKADNKVLLAKSIKPDDSFTYDGVEYSIDSSLWDSLVENKHITKAISDKTEVWICPSALGDCLKTTFKRMPIFSGKFVSQESFNTYMTAVTKKNTSLFMAIPESNSKILDYLGVEYVSGVDSDILYTKDSLLRASLQKRIDPETKKFTPESVEMFVSVFPGIDMSKAKLDTLISRCRYAVTV